jgi:hypothetical protein
MALIVWHKLRTGFRDECIERLAFGAPYDFASEGFHERYHFRLTAAFAVASMLMIGCLSRI